MEKQISSTTVLEGEKLHLTQPDNLSSTKIKNHSTDFDENEDLYPSETVAQLVAKIAIVCISLLIIGFYIIQHSHEKHTVFKLPDNNLFAKYYIHSLTLNSRNHKNNHHSCIHEQIVTAEKETLTHQPQQFFDSATPALTEKDAKPIRFHFDFSNLSKATTNSDLIEFIEKKLIPPVQSFFQDFVKVAHVDGPLKVDAAYSSKPCGMPKVAIPQDHILSGIPNTDFIVYITGEDETKIKHSAYASICPQGQGFAPESGRPTVAYISYNLALLTDEFMDDHPAVLQGWVKKTIHEIVHAMVFSSYHFSHYLKEKKAINVSNKKTIIESPTFIELAQTYFNSTTIKSIPLETQDIDSVSKSHFEKQLFGNEIMTAQTSSSSVLSQFTAAIFEISGWYIVNHQFVMPLEWAKHGWVSYSNTTACEDKSVYCSAPSKSTKCDFTYSSISTCEPNPFTDGCGLWEPIADQSCFHPSDKFRSQFNRFGGGSGSESRCWITDAVKRKIGQNINANCFESKCDYSDLNNISASFRHEDSWYKCRKGVEKIITRDGSNVFCPNIDVFCNAPEACPLSCNGNGVCKAGKCICYDGFKGDDCASS